MPDKFKNKYRNSSARWQKWDYSAEGAYFITICTAHRQCILGKIENNEMFLSDYGKIVREQWDKSFDIRKELFCDIYVIMPNHIHAIVQIKYPHGDAHRNAGTHGHNVGTHGRASLQTAMRYPIVNQNQFHRLLRDLNQSLQNASMNYATPLHNLFGNPGFMTM